MEIQLQTPGANPTVETEVQHARSDDRSPLIHSDSIQEYQQIVEPGLDKMKNVLYTSEEEEDFTEKNLLIQEVDEGRPCLECMERCPGFTKHFWRSSCHNCKCPREVHDIYHEDFVDVRFRLGWEDPQEFSQISNKDATLQAGYTWMPTDLSPEKMEDFMDHLDPQRVPRIGSAGERYRDIQLIVQLPKQDLSQDYNNNLSTPGQRKAFDDFCKTRDAEAMGIAKVEDYLKAENNCTKCGSSLEAGEIGVVAPKISDAQCWHPSCFVCTTCDEMLVDLVYCHLDGAIYCERHYAELIKPRCAACDEWDPTEVPPGRYRRGSVSHSWSDASVEHSPDRIHTPQDELIPEPSENQHSSQEYLTRIWLNSAEPQQTQQGLIFSGEYTKAMEQDWHSTHFCCFNCDLNLTGHRYILRDEHPYCIKCYENLFANCCEECKTPIGTDSKDLSYKEKHWHEKCFQCCDCHHSLVDQPFASKNEKLFCADCHDNNFAARCDGCQNIFRAGMKKYEYKGKQWHEQCFCCKVCQQPIGNKSFIPRDQEVVCVPCYEEQYAQRCMKCNGVINKGGITYKGTPWHRECFTCTNCCKMLAGEKFTSRDEKPFCAECFGDLFAKKCIRCTKPITGLGGTKFISFEERHWHSDCFVCYKCNVSLVGRGFLSDGADILCPDCGRA